MHPYGSKKRDGYSTEPRIKSARAVVKREGAELIEEQLVAAAPTEMSPTDDDYCPTCKGPCLGDS